MLFTKLIAPDSEEEIKQHWKYTDKVYISILCPCFNQEGYICDAIEGFLAQECEYRFEIIIHDDASTDSTPEILKAYQARFPSIIKLVLQTENQYSQGKQISAIAASYAQGEYLALCEGDDFWIDKQKLNKQHAILSRSHNIDICFTSAMTLDPNGRVKFFANYSKVQKIFSLSEVVRGGGGFMPTASLFFRKKIMDSMPDWFHTAPVGDYYIQILSSVNGGAVFLPSCSVVYRVNAVGSWSSSRLNWSYEKIYNDSNSFLTHTDLISSLGVLDNDISYVKSMSLLYTSIELLKHGCNKDFKPFIIRSWRSYPYLNIKQIACYGLRSFPSLMRFLLVFKTKID
ncbi:glycosyltransferase [Shewanella xiamenensis]|uniref:glycosyltransferase family 2 protein n=1 Tax=Shewanella xiamenensis TaxID=332186 RepID=UPI00244C78ED|nr:glycosyltransferase [Shewanella xiamenensis]MDH1314311.1 glycosyltransferase [Shewanella xiamenensis]